MAVTQKISPARLVSYKVLCDVFIKGAYSNISLNKHLNTSIINEADRRLATNIVYGVIKKKNKLNFILQNLSNMPLEKIDENVKTSLYMGLYQIYYLSKIPKYALTNDSVNLVKLFVNKKSGGFVNGILRNSIRKKNELKDIEYETFKDEMYYEYNVGYELYDKLIKQYSKESLKEMFEYFTYPPNVSIRVNTLKISVEDLLKIFDEREIIYERSDIKEGIIVKSHINLNKEEAFKKGYFSIQDIAPMFNSNVLDVKEGMRVLDMCAAPGGKSLHCAEIMNNKGEIIAFDIYKKKLDLINFNAKQLGVDIIKTKIKDATEYDESLGEFDRVICDVPCSGIGVVRRKPEILFNYKAENDLQSLQKKILNNAIKYLKKGGVLVYSTCTVLKEENEDVVNSVLKENKNIHIEKIDFKNIEKSGMININPIKYKSDGFFIAKLKKE